MNKHMLIILAMITALGFGITAVFGGRKSNNGGVSHAVTQTKCPVMGGDISKNIFTDYRGRRVFFCCSSCVELFRNSPGSYSGML